MVSTTVLVNMFCALMATQLQLASGHTCGGKPHGPWGPPAADNAVIGPPKSAESSIPPAAPSDATVAALGNDYHYDAVNKGVSIPPADVTIPTATSVGPAEPVGSSDIPALPTDIGNYQDELSQKGVDNNVQQDELGQSFTSVDAAAAPTSDLVAPPTTSDPAAPAASGDPAMLDPTATSATSIAPPGTTNNVAPPQGPQPDSSGGGGRGGLGINEKSGTTENLDAFLGGSIGWYYNWAPAPIPDQSPSGIEYVPMLWGDLPEKITGFKAAAANFASQGVKAVLSFNEPNGNRDKGGGSGVTAANAAKVHIDVFNGMDGIEVGAPGTTQGGDDWWKEWETECEKLGGCKYDFVPFHWYGLDAEKFKQELDVFVNGRAKGKKIWVTEWACIHHEEGNTRFCSAEDAVPFMDETIAAMKAQPSVERWAWQGAFTEMNKDQDGNQQGPQMMNPDGSLNALGQHYKTV